MNYEEAITFIKSTAYLGSKPGLERLEGLLLRLGNPEKKLKFVHVAGTNGKGSTSALIAGIVKDSGYRVGLFTSPYLERINEQMQVNGNTISEDDLACVTGEVKVIVDTMEKEAMPTEFELITAVAFLYFLKERCDLVVLETGLGGALDATNVISNTEVAVLTNIGMDHINFLGNTISSIAVHKAGIIKENCSVVSYEQEKKVETIIREKAAKENAKLTFAAFSKILVDREDLNGQYFTYGEYEHLYLPLLGSYQRKNATVAIEAISALKEKGFNIKKVSVYRGFRQVKWPARFECLHKSPYVYFDGGHNVQCIKELIQVFSTFFGEKKLIFVTGVMADKDYKAMYKLLGPYAQEFIAVEPNNERALQIAELTKVLKKNCDNVYAANSVTEGIELSLQHAKQEDVICVIGSLYMAAESRAFFQ